MYETLPIVAQEFYFKCLIAYNRDYRTVSIFRGNPNITYVKHWARRDDGQYRGKWDDQICQCCRCQQHTFVCEIDLKAFEKFTGLFLPFEDTFLFPEPIFLRDHLSVFEIKRADTVEKMAYAMKQGWPVAQTMDSFVPGHLNGAAYLTQYKQWKTMESAGSAS